MTRRAFAVLAGLTLALLVLAPVPPAWTSDAGKFAADQVSQANYDALMRDSLYTRTGHARGRNSTQHHPCRDNILSLFQSYGLPAQLDPFTYTYQGWNVVAEMRGTKEPNQIYIVGGHYDSVSNPGADDNASGVALTLEAARILSQYKSDKTIRFMAFDLEELGLYGSTSYVQRIARNEDIRGMISADMVAYDMGLNQAAIYGRTASNPIKQAVATAITTYSNGLTYRIYGTLDASDHAPFEQAGKQACLLIENDDNPNYHTSRDCYDTSNYLNFVFATKMTRAVVGWLVDNAGVQVFGLGDMNCDGLVNFGDINLFVEAFNYPNGQGWPYQCPWKNGDVNGDGDVNFGDINPFVELLSGE